MLIKAIKHKVISTLFMKRIKILAVALFVVATVVPAQAEAQTQEELQQMVADLLDQVALLQGQEAEDVEEVIDDSQTEISDSQVQPSIEDLQQMINSLLAQVAQLQSQVGESSDHSATVCPYTWTRNLELGDEGADVMRLQEFLNADPDTRLALTGPGSDGMETDEYNEVLAAAVSKFQVKYRAEVLSPLGLVNPTGEFNPATRAKANSLCVAQPVEEEEVGELPSCTISSDKSSYVFGEPIELSWSSENAVEAYFETWHGGKDHITVPSSNQDLNGSITVAANVLGNPTVQLYVVSEEGYEYSCLVRFSVDYAEEEVDEEEDQSDSPYVYDTDGDGWIYGTDHDDEYIGDRKENILVGSAGDDYMDGGADWDEVNYVERDACFADFTIRSFSNGTHMIRSARYGIDTLVNIEAVYFVGCGGYWHRLDGKG
jgi:hypothetical protein